MTTTAPGTRNQIFKLPDGRNLGYTEFGSLSGKPLLYFHGYPSSRLEAYPVDDMARKLDIRVISLDRPGFGISTPQPGRRLLDWPLDVQEFAKGLNLENFAVMGLSGGGPYALACAYALPKEMLTGVGLFASGPPWAAGAHHMSLTRQLASVMSRRYPRILRAIFGIFVRFTKWLVNSGPIARRIDRWLEKQDAEKEEKDGVIATAQAGNSASSNKRPTAERRENLVRMLFDEPFAQGADAAVHEANLLSSPDWGFAFENVSYDTVRIWHGVKDKNAPIAAIRYMAHRLPHCVLHEFPDDTHYTMWRHFEGALTETVTEKPSEKEGAMEHDQ
jgi:pimeloyl-ACP methyl ester carboxylesterase